MATFTQLWMLSCVLLVAPTIFVIVIVIVKKFDSRDHCHQKGRLYPIYKKLEDALMNNSEALNLHDEVVILPSTQSSLAGSWS